MTQPFRLDAQDAEFSARVPGEDWPAVFAFRDRPQFLNCVSLYVEIMAPFFAHNFVLNKVVTEAWRFQMLVFALHLHAFWFGVLAVMQILNWTPVNWAGGAVMLVYTLLAGKRVYGGVWWQRGLRAILLSALYVSLLFFTVVLAWLLALIA